MTEHSLTLTANQRLASYLQYEFAQAQTENGLSCWLTPPIYSLQHWLDEQWQLAYQYSQQALPQRLKAHQTQLLWQQIIMSSGISTALLNINEIATSTQQAWLYAQLWELDFSHYEFDATEESMIFRDWAQEYANYCQQNDVVDDTSYLAVLMPLWQEKILPVPSKIELIGFDTLPPLHASILATLESLGCQISHANKIIDNKSVKLHAFADTKTELATMAAWAEQQWQDKKSRIACVVPSLHKIRHQVVSTFAEQFNQYEQAPYNISAGNPLSEYAIIISVFSILRLQDASISVYELSHLLRSPFLHAAECEIEQRHLLDITIRDYGEIDIPVYKFLQLAEANECIELYKNLHTLRETVPNKTQLPSEWAAHFTKLLHIMGWPGERHLNSEEYQLLQRMFDVMDELTMLDQLQLSWTSSQALHELKRLTDNNLFQVQTETTPIQILGVLEAAGMTFDAIWIMEMHDENWPAAAAPNPLLPLTLQREFDMPHASAQRELEFSRRLTQRFCQSTPSIIFSYPQFDGDRELKVSPLLKQFTLSSASEFLIHNRSQKVFSSADMEAIDDQYGPAVNDSNNIKGGSSIFKKMAACPFQSFAALRLKASGIPAAEVSLDPATRGTCLHAALEFIWLEIKSSQKLSQLSAKELANIIDCSVTKAIKLLQHNYLSQLSEQFVDIETKRLSKIMHNWLALEKLRPDFQVVSQEEWSSTEFAGIPLHLRIDRIDKTVENKTLIIDYKSGKTHTSDWFGDRMNEPQLPLYCVTQTDVDAIAFAQVRMDESGYKGVGESDCGIKAVVDIEKVKFNDSSLTWRQQRERWKKQLTQLAEDFCAGVATVDPKEATTCNYCEFAELCRIHEQQ